MPITSNPSDKYVSVSAQLMQNYRNGAPLTGQSQIAPVQDALSRRNGLVSIGTDNHVYLILPDTSSDTGWSCVDTQCPLQPKYVTAATVGTSYILAASDGTSLQQYANNQWSAQSSPVTSIGGLKASYMADPAQCVLGVQQAASDVTYVNDPNLPWQCAIPAGVYPPADWCPAIVMDYSASTPVPARGVFLLYSDNGITQISAFAAVNGGQGAGGSLGGNYIAVKPACLGPYSNPLVLSSDDLGIYYLYANGPQKPTYEAWKVSGDFAMSSFATSANNDFVQLFGISTDHHLYFTEMNLNSAVWTPMFALNVKLEFAQVVAAPNLSGYTEAFGVTTAGDLYRIWQEPGSLEWNFEEIEIQQASGTVSGKIIEEYDSYNLQVNVYDADQVLQSGAAVTISVAEPITMEINGSTRFLDRTAPASATTNIAGQITLTVKTSELAIQPLRISTPAMPSGDSIELDASGPTLKTLAAVTGSTLATQQVQHPDGTSSNLVDTHYAGDSELMDHVAQAVSSTMGLAHKQNAVSTGAPFQSFYHPSDALVARYLRAEDSGKPHIPSEPLQEQFIVDFSGVKPVTFRSLTPGEADQMIRACQSPIDGFRLLGVDWGEVWDEVKEGVARVVSYVVKTVKEGIHVALTFVIDGAKYVWDQVIAYGKEFVQRAFDLVQEVFDRVKVGWAKLMGWLGFIFAWGDIRRSHQAVAHSVDAMLGVFEEGITLIKTTFDSAVGTFESYMKDNIESAIQNFSGDKDQLFQYQESVDLPNPQVETLASTNVMFTGFMNNAAQGTTGGEFLALAPEDESAIRQLMESLIHYVEGMRSADAFKQSIEYFEKAVKTPDQIGDLLISGLLSLVEGLMLTLTAGFQTIVDLVFDAVLALVRMVRKALNASWNIPFVSDLYRKVMGSDLSAIDLIASIIAVPGTVFYKLVFNAAPFPTEQSVADFKQTFTPKALLAAIGLTNSGAKASPVAFPASLVSTMNAFFAANTMIYSFMIAAVDAWPAKVPMPELLVWGTFGCEFVLLGTSALGQIDTSAGISFPAGVSNWLFLGQGIGTFIDGLCVFLEKKFPANIETFGIGGSYFLSACAVGCTLVETFVVKPPGSVIAANFFGIAPGLFKILRQADFVKQSKGGTLAALGLIDIICLNTSALITIGTLNPSANQKALSAT